jgi:hypothetical protein
LQAKDIFHCVAPHYESAAPVTGATEKVSFDFENTVTRIHEDP